MLFYGVADEQAADDSIRLCEMLPGWAGARLGSDDAARVRLYAPSNATRIAIQVSASAPRV